jgi:hypothetical protein
LSLAKVADRLNTDGHRTSVGNERAKVGVQRLVDVLKLDDLAESTALDMAARS